MGVFLQGISQGKERCGFHPSRVVFCSDGSMVSFEVMLVRGKNEEESYPHWKWKIGLPNINYKGLQR